MNFLDALFARDPEAIARLRRMRILAAAGDANAERAFRETCRAFYARRYPNEWAETDLLARGLAARDPIAARRVHDLTNRARANDGGSMIRLAMLRAHSGRSQPAPGAAQIGYHPMPSRVRHGVSFGQRSQLRIPIFGIAPLAPPGTGSVTYQIPGFPPVTPQVLYALLQFIQGALMSRPLERERYIPPTEEIAPMGPTVPLVPSAASMLEAARPVRYSYVDPSATFIESTKPTLASQYLMR